MELIEFFTILLLFFFLMFFFWGVGVGSGAWLHEAYGISVLKTGIEPTPFTFEGEVQTTGLSGNSLRYLCFYMNPFIEYFVQCLLAC